MTAHGFNFYSGNINKRYARQYALPFFFYNSIDVNTLNMHYILKIRSTFTIPCRTISVRCRKNQMQGLSNAYKNPVLLGVYVQMTCCLKLT